MTWPTKRQQERQRQWQIHLKNTFKEQSLRLLTFETFDQSDEKTWADQQKDNDEDKDNDKHIKGAPSIFRTFDLWDIWSEWWENMTWPTKRQQQRRRQIQWQWQIHFENAFKERSLRLVTFETFDQSDEKTWPEEQQQKNNEKDKNKDNDKYI